MPDDISPKQAPDFSKTGFGAMGNVEVKHDASHHSHHEDKSQHSHVHYHGVPLADAPSQAQGSTAFGSGGHAGSGSRRHLTINILIGMGGLSLLLWFFKPPPQPPVVVPVPFVTSSPGVTEVLQAKLNKLSYKVDDLMEITITSQQDGYLYVLAVWADGRVDTLFPNSLRPDAKIAAGFKMNLPKDFPPTADGQVLSYPMRMPEVTGNPSHATESIIAVVSPTPLDLPKSTELAPVHGLAAVGMIDDPEFRTRGPQPKFMKLQSGLRLDFGGLPQAAVHYDIHR